MKTGRHLDRDSELNMESQFCQFFRQTLQEGEKTNRTVGISFLESTTIDFPLRSTPASGGSWSPSDNTSWPLKALARETSLRFSRIITAFTTVEINKTVIPAASSNLFTSTRRPFLPLSPQVEALRRMAVRNSGIGPRLCSREHPISDPSRGQFLSSIALRLKGRVLRSSPEAITQPTTYSTQDHTTEIQVRQIRPSHAQGRISVLCRQDSRQSWGAGEESPQPFERSVFTRHFAYLV